MPKKIPPSESSERAMLGCFMQKPTLFDEIPNWRSIFGQEIHLCLADKIKERFEKGLSVEYLAMIEEYSGNQTMQGVVTDCYTKGVSVAMVDMLLPELQGKAAARLTLYAAHKLIEQVPEARTIGEVQNIHHEALDSVYKYCSAVTVDTQTQRGRLLEYIENLEEEIKGKTNQKYILTPFYLLNKNTGGMGPGQIIVIAGPTGGGKSVLAKEFGRVAAEKGNEVCISSLEMPYAENVDRFISGIGKVNVSRLMNRSMDAGEVGRVTIAIGEFSKLPIKIYDDRNTLEGNLAMIREMKGGLWIIDYIQLMSGIDGNDEQTQEQKLAQISSSLKRIAKQTGTRGIILSQLNDKGQLRASRAIGHDADAIIELRLDNNKKPKEIYVNKWRNGPVGYSVPVNFEGEFMTFSDRSIVRV